MTKLRNFTKGELREFSIYPFSRQLIFDQTLSNVIVFLIISEKNLHCGCTNELACCIEYYISFIVLQNVQIYRDRETGRQRLGEMLVKRWELRRREGSCQEGRKTDRVLNKGDDVVVCLPGAKIEAISERVENIVVSGKGGSVSRRDK